MSKFSNPSGANDGATSELSVSILTSFTVSNENAQGKALDVSADALELASAEIDESVDVEPDYQPAMFARIAEVAQQEATMFRSKQVAPIKRTVEEARAQLEALAPVVRGLLHEVELIDTNFNAHGQDERNGYRVECPAVLAHFAVLALEVQEATL